MTTVFYAPPELFVDGRVELPEEEARHAIRVLRHRVGDELVVVDGVGGRHRTRLVEADRDRAVVQVLDTAHEVGEPEYQLTIALATLKNTNRFETFAEKAVELGVAEIIPLATRRTERVRMKEGRLENILVAAMKQSGRTRLPVLRPPSPLRDVLEGREEGLRLLCHESADPESGLLSRLSTAAPDAPITVLIGPEGGFDDEEVSMARSKGFGIVSLGRRRLRAETAAIAVAAAVALSLGR